MSIAVWRVRGEASTDSSGGLEEWIYLTADEVTLPDVMREIRPGGRSRHWYRVKSVELLGTIDTISDAVVGAEGLLATAIVGHLCGDAT